MGCSQVSSFRSPHFFFFFLVAHKLNESSVSSPPAVDGSWYRRSFVDQYPEAAESVSYIDVPVLQLEIAAVTR